MNFDLINCVVVHYGELGLKRKNRLQFEKQLIRNLKQALSRTIPRVKVRRQHGLILVELPQTYDWEAIRERLEKIFGVAYFAPAVLTEQNMDTITAVAVQLMEGLQYESFRVKTKRSEKSFPLTSPEISRIVGAAIQAKSGVRVDLSHPEVTCHIEIFEQQALVYTQKLPGAGGLPVGSSGTVVSLISSGIDSPVASWKIMKRGARVIFVHFHSIPFTCGASVENVKDIVRLLTEYQFRSRLYLVPFLPVQEEIIKHQRADYRVVMYRRNMMRIAERIAEREGALALVTGESIGQVSSQTLENLRVINAGISLPVLRPLSGDDKQEIVNLAERIGTFRISTRPYDDSCSFFVPRHPVTRARLSTAREIEQELNLEPLLEKAIEDAEVIDYTFPE